MMSHDLTSKMLSIQSRKTRGNVVVHRKNQRPWMRAASSSAPHAAVFQYTQIEMDTIHPGISIHDITSQVKEAIVKAGVKEGAVTILSRHTTTAVVINEAETRLMDDMRQWLHKMADPNLPYLHNDLSRREAPQGWPGGHSEWVKQEPINAHSLLLSAMLGNTLHVPVNGGRLCVGTWQSILLVELDGPRKRSVGIQVMGNATTATAHEAEDLVPFQSSDPNASDASQIQIFTGYDMGCGGPQLESPQGLIIKQFDS